MGGISELALGMLRWRHHTAYSLGRVYRCHAACRPAELPAPGVAFVAGYFGLLAVERHAWSRDGKTLAPLPSDGGYR